MFKYVCDDTKKLLDELLVVQRAIEKEIRKAMVELRNLDECGDVEFGRYSAKIYRLGCDYSTVNELEKNISKTPYGAVIALGTFHKLMKYNQNIEDIFSCAYSEC